MKDPPAPTTGERRAPWLVGLALAAPVLWAASPPMCDFPQYELMVALLQRYGDPLYAPRELYARSLANASQGFFDLALPLALLTSARTACKLLIALSIAGFPVAAARLGAHLGRTRWGSLLVAPFARGLMSRWGLIANLLGLVLFLLAVPSLDRYAAAPSRREGLRAALWALAFAAVRGGRSHGQFSEMPHMPVRFREGRSWETTLGRVFRPTDLVPEVDARRFRYLLARVPTPDMVPALTAALAGAARPVATTRGLDALRVAAPRGLGDGARRTAAARAPAHAGPSAHGALTRGGVSLREGRAAGGREPARREEAQQDVPLTPLATGARQVQLLRQASSLFWLPSSQISSGESTTPLPQLGVGAQHIAKALCSLHP